MSKTPVRYKKVTINRPTSFRYDCDTCGNVFAKGERKVTYQDGTGTTKYACYDKPCSPFSNPKGYENVWNNKTQNYEWKKI